MSRFLKVKEVAEILQVSIGTVYKLIHSGQVKAVRVGKVYRIDPADLAEYLKATTPERGQPEPTYRYKPRTKRRKGGESIE